MSLLGSKRANEPKEPKQPKPAKAPKAPKAAKAPKAPKTADASAGRGVLVEKPKANIYTVLLILSFVAILVGCLCLYAEMSAYNFDMKARV